MLTTGGAYALGCFNTGYYLVRCRDRVDIRCQGSGSTGASNVYRNHGAFPAAVTFLGDFGKGALAVYLTLRHSAGLTMWTGISAALAVVCGHVWPAQLKFHGGKGAATALGALLLLDARLTLGLLLLFVVILALLRHFTRSGLAVIAVAPAVALMAGRPWPVLPGLVALSCVVLVGHRDNIREWWGGRANRSQRVVEASPPPDG